MRGEIWMAALDPVRGSEQAGTRPVLVIQPDAMTAFLRTVFVIPFTSNLNWERYPFCARAASGEGGLTNASVALCHQARVIDKTRLIRLMGQLPEDTLARIEQALRVAAGL